MHKNDKAGVVDNEQLHRGSFGVPSGGAGIGLPPVHALIKSEFVEGGLQLLQRIVNDFKFVIRTCVLHKKGGLIDLECVSSLFQMDREQWP